MKKETFNEIVDGLELEYPDEPVLRNYSALSAFEAAELMKAMSDLSRGDAYGIISFFMTVLPVDKKSRKKMKNMPIKDMAKVMDQWQKENAALEGME